MSAGPFKLGLKPPRPNAIQLKTKDYMKSSAPFVIPDNLGDPTLVPIWHMLGNDQVGNCFWAGTAHETYLWTAATGNRAHITTWDTFDDYHDCTGFAFGDPSTDQGTDMQAGASYRRRIGIRDTTVKRHKIAAYTDIEAGNVGQMLDALRTYKLCGLGLIIGDNQQDQFTAGQPWNGDPGPNPGGHYAPLVAVINGVFFVVTWGALQPVTVNFLEKQCDQAIAYHDTLTPQLKDDLAQVTKKGEAS